METKSPIDLGMFRHILCNPAIFEQWDEKICSLVQKEKYLGIYISQEYFIP